MLLRHSRRRTQNPASGIDLDIKSQVKIIGRKEKPKTTNGMRVMKTQFGHLVNSVSDGGLALFESGLGHVWTWRIWCATSS